MLVLLVVLAMLMFSAGCVTHDSPPPDGSAELVEDENSDDDDTSGGPGDLGDEGSPDPIMPDDDDGDDDADDDTDPCGERGLWLSPPRADTPAESAVAARIRDFNEKLLAAMDARAGYGAKIAALRDIARRDGGDLIATLRVSPEGDRAGVAVSGMAASALAARLVDRLESATAPAAASAIETDNEPVTLHAADVALDRYWMFYHWSEILGRYQDDSDWTDVFAWADRASFIDEEIGERGVEMTMDYWRVPIPVWTNGALSLHERLMHAKYAMWDNPDWSEQDWVTDYWKLQPAFVDEDSPLFTGNTMASLAFEYELTRGARTLERLRAIHRAYMLTDRFLLDGDHPLDQGETDGRIQRGPMTKNMYPEDEAQIFDVTSWIPFEYNYVGGFPDHLTGRERKNVSRDQYYGTLLGHFAVREVFARMQERTPEETAYYCETLAHLDAMLEYLFSDRIIPGHGLDYNLYALIEGALANPPNLTFMNFWAYPAYEDVLGRDLGGIYDAGGAIVDALLELGAILELVDLSQSLFEPAHSGLTGLNQYMFTLWVSDLSPEQWQFVYPPEVLVAHPERYNLWRRVIALFVRKYGVAGNAIYRDVLNDMMADQVSPADESEISWSWRPDVVHIEPAGPLEDWLLPFTAVAGAATDRQMIGWRLRDRYHDMVLSGAIDFADTDLPYGE